MHAEARAFVENAVRRYHPPPPVWEIGSRNINGGVRDLFGDPYFGIDLEAGRGVDQVGDARSCALPFVPATVVCCEVLEHAADAAGIIARIGQQLARGGWCILTCATVGRAAHSGIDGGALRAGEYYRNYLPEEIIDWLITSGIAPIETLIDPARGDLYIIGQS